jgi:hypothetical protein
MGEVAEAIEEVLIDSTNAAETRLGFKASLWDLFSLDPHNVGEGTYSDRGKTLDRLNSKTLARVRRWLEDNSDQAIERYGFGRWKGLRDSVAIIAFQKRLPPDTQLLSGKPEGNLPLQGVAVTVGGKKWDLTKPIRAALLRQQRRYFSERDMANLLGMKRFALRHMLRRMDKAAFTLNRFMPGVLIQLVRGEDRGPKQKP